MSTTTQAGPAVRSGRNELGTISIADGVITKIAARAAAEDPDAGAAAARMLGRAVPGASRLPGVRDTNLEALPKTSVVVDGSKAYVTLELSVRWPVPVPEVTGRDPVSGIKMVLIRAASSGTGTAHRARICTLTRPPLTTTPSTLRPGR